MNDPDHGVLATSIIDANAYLTLATADAEGRPWASPVWFAHDRYARYVWASRPEARHSRNIIVRPHVGIVIFDSTVPDGTGQGVYVEATARAVAGTDLVQLLQTYSDRSVVRGGAPWQLADVAGDAPHRLYVADALAHYVLADGDQRVPVTIP